MREISFGYETSLAFSGEVTEHYFKLRILPEDNGRQRITGLSPTVSPVCGLLKNRDGFLNYTLNGYIGEPHDYFKFGISGTAEVSEDFGYPGECLPAYRFPTPLTAAGEEIRAFYNARKLSAPNDILKRALFFSEAVFHEMNYVSGATNIKTAAKEAFSRREGVCQDFSHILLSVLRLDGIPCRYNAGIASNEGETHAWTEVFSDGLWYGIDPTRNQCINGGYIKLAHGRDYSDCPIERGVYKGPFGQIQNIKLRMELGQ